LGEIMGTGKRRSRSQIARDRRRTADLYLQGWLQTDIADDIGVSASTVSRDLKALHQEWQASALLDFDKAKAAELAKIDRLEREYWEAWVRSCEDAETIRQEGDPKAKPSKVVRTFKGQAGDPRFLQGIQWCIDRRCKILGVDAPQRHEVKGSIETKDTSSDRAEILRALRRIADAGATNGVDE